MNVVTRRFGCLVLAFLLALTSAGTSQAQTANYVLDASHTSVVFSIGHLGISKTYGTFRKVSGKVSLDPKKEANNNLEVSLDVASIDTNDAKRDDHLRAADFFNAKQFPDMTFKSTKIHSTDDALEVTGDFTMHGVTKSTTLTFKKGGEAKDPYGNLRVGFSSEFKVKRSDYGMKTMVGPISDDVSIMVSFEGILQK